MKLLKDLWKDRDNKWSLGRIMSSIQFSFMMYHYPIINEYQIWLFLVNAGWIKINDFLLIFKNKFGVQNEKEIEN